MARDLAPPSLEVADRLPLTLEEVEPASPLRIVGLLGERGDALLDLSQALHIEIAVHRMERPRHIRGALVQAVHSLLDLGQQLPLRSRQPLHELENGLPVALDLLDRREV